MFGRPGDEEVSAPGVGCRQAAGGSSVNTSCGKRTLAGMTCTKYGPGGLLVTRPFPARGVCKVAHAA